MPGYVFSMAQTADGYLWLGSVNGLFRFDGVRVTPFEFPGGEHLPSEDVRKLLVARNGALWIGTRKGLVSWAGGTLTRYPELDGFGVLSLTEEQDGTVWAAGLDSAEARRLCSIRNGHALCEGGSAGANIIYSDSRGTLWRAEGNILKRSGSLTSFTLPAQIHQVLEDRDHPDAALIATRGGLYRLQGESIAAYPLPWGNEPVARMLRDRDGGLWVGSQNHGLLHVHNERLDVFDASDGLTGDWIRAIFEDREGNIWVASNDGLDRFRDPAVVLYSVKQGMSSPEVSSVLAARDGTLWIGTYDGLNRLQDGQFIVYRKGARGKSDPTRSRETDAARDGYSRAGREIYTPGLPDDYITSLFQDTRGRIWVATKEGLAHFEDDRFTPSSGLPPTDWVDSFAEDDRGVWISSAKAGIGVLSRRGVDFLPRDAVGGERRQVRSLLVDPQRGGMWLGFVQGGLSYLKGGQVLRTFTSSDGLGEGSVHDIQLVDGAPWAATEGGLSRVTGDRVVTLTRHNGLPCDAALWVAGTEQALWTQLSCGIARISRDELGKWISDPKKRIEVSVMDAMDGVRVQPYPSGAHPGVTTDKEGKIWFSSLGGLGMLDPRHLPSNPVPPPVHVEALFADGKSYAIENHLHLPPRIRDLTIDYTSLSLAAPERVHFRFRLEGQDHAWREVVNERHVQYSNLAPGNYRFHVIASNNSGVWNEKGASIDFSIAPAYWQTTWFRALCVVAILAFLWMLYWLRMRQLAHEFDLKLESRVDERTRIARELHDTLLQSFNAALVRFRTAHRLLLNRPDEGREVLESAIDDAREALSEGRQAVQGLRSSVVETNELSEAIRKLAEELASEPSHAGGAEVRLNIAGTPRALRPLIRDDIYRLVGEALRNALRHAQASHIEAQLVYDARRFELRVRDDGKGIDPKHLREGGLPGHFGLPGMRERAQRIGGKFTVWSAPDSGTEIAVSIPGGRAYAQQARRSWLARKILSDKRDAESV